MYNDEQDASPAPRRAPVLGSMRARKPVIFMTVGLPGSGKTTWAEAYLRGFDSFLRQEQSYYDATRSLWTIRISKDDLRVMLRPDFPYSQDFEEDIVCPMRDRIAEHALFMGYDVIIDDTNFHPKHRAAMEVIAARYGAKIEMRDFTGVSLDLCIARDRQRPKPVGEAAIRAMYAQYLAGKPHVSKQDDDVPQRGFE